MAAKQHVTRMTEFASAMLAADSGFADRVRHFEKCLGRGDADTLAVLAQSAYFCWGNQEHQSNLIEVCHAIRTGKPTSMFYHAQITAARWAQLHAYVIGVQRWLGVELPLALEIDGRKIAQIREWLGERHPAKDALAMLLLSKLIASLLDTAFAPLGGDVEPEDVEYTDFSSWYLRADGGRYAGHDSGAFAEDCKQRVRQHMMDSPPDAEELINGILGPDNPPCLHRFSRHQDIKITSIGALKWRGNLPPDDVPKDRWLAFLDEARTGLQLWVDGARPATSLACRLHKVLGEGTARTKAIVRDFLLAENRGVASDWVGRKAREEGFQARLIFEGNHDAQ